MGGLRVHGYAEPKGVVGVIFAASIGAWQSISGFCRVAAGVLEMRFLECGHFFPLPLVRGPIKFSHVLAPDLETMGMIVESSDLRLLPSPSFLHRFAHSFCSNRF